MSRRLGMRWKRMLQEMDGEELTYQMAYDLMEAEEMQQRAGARPAPTPAGPAGPQWIDLADPDAFAKLKQRMGMA